MDFFVLSFQRFMLIFVRITALLFVEPIFGSQTIPSTVRFGFGFLITAVVYPMVDVFIGPIPSDVIEYALLAISQAFIGVSIGFCLQISFAIYQLAAQFFTVQLGFGASEVFDPMSEISIPLVGQYLYVIGILVFLAIKGPLFVLREIILSFELITPEKIANIKLLSSENGFISLFANMFSIALRLSMPVAGTLLLVSITMGLLAKAAPQMDLLMIGFPISIIVGFIIITITLPVMIEFFDHYIMETFNSIWKLMLELKSG